MIKTNIILFISVVFLFSSPAKSQVKTDAKIAYWLTKGDHSVLLKKQTNLIFSTTPNNNPSIEIDEKQSYQTVDGFGYTFTGGSAYLISQMNKTEREKLLKELFGNAQNSIGISYLRISIGASDLDTSVFSYDDLLTGKTDPNLANFSLKPDQKHLIPLLKEILKINPKLKILGTPWSPPVWMKSNDNSMGGTLLPLFYETYANYLVKYSQKMKAEGIKIDAITIQNEPQNDKNNPSMLMSAVEQANFIKNNLGPAFKLAKIKTKIIIWDHNCDMPDFPISVLNDAAAKPFIDGTAFHLYSGDVSALSKVRKVHPDKNLYFTEQWTGSKGTFEGDLKWHLKNVVIGSMRNWSRNTLEWNLANDSKFEPHTPGGCTECKGALTISESAVTRNVSYYIIAHASKFVPTGSVRIESNMLENLPNVAFKTPTGKKILIVENDGKTEAVFNIKYTGKWAVAMLPAASVGTFVW